MNDWKFVQAGMIIANELSQHAQIFGKDGRPILLKLMQAAPSFDTSPVKASNDLELLSLLAFHAHAVE